MELKINKVLYEVTDPDELRVRLAQIPRTQFSEVWMQHAAGWPAIGALINGEAAWLMYVRHEGDAGFSTRNPQYAGPEKAIIEYYLPSLCTQRERSLPSKSTTASDGARPGDSCVLAVAGSITGGSGRLRS